MNPKWAEENLQTIRTLMERSALYRRALAPIMLFAGTLGMVAADVGITFHFYSFRAFGSLWLSTAMLAVVGAFLIARRQAIKVGEKFWSPPTRRVAQALLPPLLAGFVLGSWPIAMKDVSPEIDALSSLVWILLYGCALHSAGFFMPRGIKLFGWFFMACACCLFIALFVQEPSDNFSPPESSANWLMGFFFGGLHLAYGIYLYFTEKKSPNA